MEKYFKNHDHIFLTTAMDIRSKKEHVFLKRKKGSKERKKATRTAFVSQFLLT